MNVIPYNILAFFYSISLIILGFYLHLCDFGDHDINKPKPEDKFLYYDFIVVGAGSAGSVVARRLAVDPGHSVLLLEAGGSPGSVMDIPFVAPLLQLTKYDWQYKTEPQQYACFGLKNKSSLWPRGKVLGGSSRLNYMMYVRGDPKDYDAWEQAGNPGWSYENVLPFFKQAESHYGRFKEDVHYHGLHGPLAVSDVAWTSELVTAFIEAGRLLGYDVGDLNGQLNSGFMFTQLTIKNGRRHSCDSAYLDKRANLHVLPYSHVEKVLFRSNKEAFGVQFNHHGQDKIAIASKEIIMSSGAIGSPHILLLSGIGPSKQLAQHKIPVIKHLPGVGQNLQDHLTTGTDTLLLDPPASDLALLLPSLMSPFSLYSFLFHDTGPMTSAAVEAMAFIHTPLVNKSTDPPDLQFGFMPLGYSLDCGKYFRYISGVSDQVWNKYFGILCGKAVASIIPMLLHPYSRGELRLRSSNPYDYPLIDPRYLSHPKDVETMVQGMHFVEKLAASTPFSEIGARLNTNPMPGCEKFKFGSDKYWECYVRHLSLTVFHPAGTCKMGPATSKDTVVDHELRVHGMQRLRVIDASIMPEIVGANINAATIMIGEKGALMIRNYWKIRESSCSWKNVLLNLPRTPL